MFLLKLCGGGIDDEAIVVRKFLGLGQARLQIDQYLPKKYPFILWQKYGGLKSTNFWVVKFGTFINPKNEIHSLLLLLN